MRKTKKAAIKVAPYITGFLLLVIVVGAAIILIWPNIISNDAPDIPSNPAQTVDSQPAIITLGTNGGVLYEWNYKISDEEIIKYENLELTDEAPGTEGGPVTLRYYFKGLKEGEATITFEYSSFVHEEEPPIETHSYHVKVDSNLNAVVDEEGISKDTKDKDK